MVAAALPPTAKLLKPPEVARSARRFSKTTLEEHLLQELFLGDNPEDALCHPPHDHLGVHQLPSRRGRKRAPDRPGYGARWVPA